MYDNLAYICYVAVSFISEMPDGIKKNALCKWFPEKKWLEHFVYDRGLRVRVSPLPILTVNFSACTRSSRVQ